jgi:hypothetical protein
MQDKTAGIFVFRGAAFDSTLHAGQLIEVTDITTADDFSPSINLKRVFSRSAM